MVLAVAAVILPPSAGRAVAQEPDTIEALVPGHRSISLNLPDGGGAMFGIWKVHSANWNRGLLVNASVEAAGADGVTGNDVESFGLFVGPAFRRYIARSGPVAPFVYTDLTVGGSVNRRSATGDSPAMHVWQAGLGASLGLGAEWFPLRRASVAGFTGAHLSATVGRDNSSATPATAWRVAAGTMSSTISLQIYF
ncbi:MAG: hypothetical protein IRZ00_04010 [Gemmatimonadetes bacterium]|nr:hypothetical protein [Gemmatimonadota bacterium]